jgi:Matrixin
MPPRPDVLPRSAPKRPGRDPVLLAVIAIGLFAVVTAATLAIAPPGAPITAARPTPTPTATRTHDAAASDAPTGPGGGYAFLDVTFADGRRVPIRWNPCQPIEYQLEFQVRPPGVRAAVDAAIDQTSVATGIRFRYDGQTTVDPHHVFDTYFFADALANTYRPVLITIVSHAMFQTFEPSKRAVAFAHPEEGNRDQNHQYVAGIVVIDGGVRYAQEGRWSLSLVIQHELGHMMGLGHVRAADELMFSFETAHHSIPDPISGWGPGDLEGLSQLGADQGCLPRVRVKG